MIVKRKPDELYFGGAVISLSSKYSVMLDLDDYERQGRYHWRPKRKKKKIYAVRRFVRNGKTYEISMHNSIMKPPKGYDVHHINHNTLDNRKSNLENVPHNRHPH